MDAYDAHYRNDSYDYMYGKLSDKPNPISIKEARILESIYALDTTISNQQTRISNLERLLKDLIDYIVVEGDKATLKHERKEIK